MSRKTIREMIDNPKFQFCGCRCFHRGHFWESGTIKDETFEMIYCKGWAVAPLILREKSKSVKSI